MTAIIISFIAGALIFVKVKFYIQGKWEEAKERIRNTENDLFYEKQRCYEQLANERRKNKMLNEELDFKKVTSKVLSEQYETYIEQLQQKIEELEGEKHD